jgi:predicted nucleic acid-binding protein
LNERYVLDTFAVIAYLRGEASGEAVRDLLWRAQNKEVALSFCLVNYGEVLYMTERKGGLEAATEAIRIVEQLPLDIAPVDRALTFAAAHIKVLHPISYADAFAVALTQELKATVVTGDPEFRSVEGLVTVQWL